MAINPASDSAPAAVLEAAREPLAALADRLTSAMSDDDLLDAMTAVQRHRGTLDALEVRLVAEIDVRDVAKKRLKWGSTADWYAHLSGGFRRGASKFVRHCRALTADYPATLAAVAEGETSLPQAGVIVDAVDALPTSPALREQAEQVLLAESKRLTATELTQAGQHVVEVVDRDRVERRLEAALDREERAAHVGRFFSVVADGAGGVRLKGYGSVEDGEVLRAALLPLTKPVPAVDPDDPTCETQRDPRDHGARMWDALVQTAQHSLDTDYPPESHGARPRVVVTTTDTALVTGTGLGTGDGTGDGTGCPTETGQRLSEAAVKRLSCHADLIPGIIAFDGRVLDVGRMQRLVTAAIWVALVLRDQHCAWPGCTRPPSMCHAHHIVHWADGGPTALTNLVLLCGEHHRVIHHTPWEVRLSQIDGRPEFLPPPRRGSQTDDVWIRHRPRRE